LALCALLWGRCKIKAGMGWAEASRAGGCTSVLPLLIIAGAAAKAEELTFKPCCHICKRVVVPIVVDEAEDFLRATLKAAVKNHSVVGGFQCYDAVVVEMTLERRQVFQVVRTSLADSCVDTELLGPLLLEKTTVTSKDSLVIALRFFGSANGSISRIVVDLGLYDDQGTSHAESVAVPYLDHATFCCNLLLDLIEQNMLPTSAARELRLNQNVQLQPVVNAELLLALHCLRNDSCDSFS
jgi:hypothetical protein